MERVEQCEKQIWATSKNIAACGCQVVLNLGFTKLAKRKLFNHFDSISLYYCPHSKRRKRVLEINNNKGETFSFKVTPGMFDFMEKECQRPIDKELRGAVIVDTHSE